MRRLDHRHGPGRRRAGRTNRRRGNAGRDRAYRRKSHGRLSAPTPAERMKELAFCVAAILCTSVFAEEPDQLARAIQPLEEGVPLVAVVRLRELLATKLPDDTRRLALLKLAESLVAAGESDQALQVTSDPLLQSANEANFLRAQALSGLGRWNEALP